MKLGKFQRFCRATTTRYELALVLEEVCALHLEQTNQAMDLEDQIRHLLVLVITELITVDAGDELSTEAMDLFDELLIAHMRPAVIKWLFLNQRQGPIGPDRPMRAMLQVVDAVLERTCRALDAVATGRLPPTRADYPEIWGHP